MLSCCLAFVVFVAYWKQYLCFVSMWDSDIARGCRPHQVMWVQAAPGDMNRRGDTTSGKNIYKSWYFQMIQSCGCTTIHHFMNNSNETNCNGIPIFYQMLPQKTNTKKTKQKKQWGGAMVHHNTHSFGISPTTKWEEFHQRWHAGLSYRVMQTLIINWCVMRYSFTTQKAHFVYPSQMVYILLSN